MALIRDIKIGMSVNPAAFSKGLRSAGMALGRFQSAAMSVQGVILGLGTGLAIGKVAGGIGEAIGAASDLNEQVSKSKVVFGSASAGVEADAKKMGDAFGYPKAQFIEGASSIGLIAKASGLSQSAAADMGSSFAKLSADASSFFNVPVEEALMAIRSGLVGEAEPMRRFGVLLNEAAVKSEALRLGLSKAGAELTEGQKVQARASLITKGLTDAQGDLARTASGVANMARSAEGRWTNAMADIGTAIQPVTEKIYALRDSAMRALTDELNSNADALKAWAGDAAAAGGGVANAFERVGTAAAVTVEAIHVGQLAWTGFAAAGQTAIARLVGLLADMTEAVNSFMSSITGKEYDSTFIRAYADELAATAKASTKNFEDLKAVGSGADRIAALFAKIRAGAGVPVAGAGGAVAKAEPAAAGMATNAKLEKSTSDLEKSLQTEIATFGMAGKAAELYKLKLRGATDEQLKMAKSLDAQLQGMQLREQFESPVAKLAKERNRLQGLFDAGAIDKGIFGKGMAAAREGLGPSGPRYAGATMAGSTEAYSSQLRFADRGTAKDEPMKATAKNTEKQVDILGRIDQGIMKLVDKGLGAAGGAVAELFAF
jgi:hypothetical protein